MGGNDAFLRKRQYLVEDTMNMPRLSIVVLSCNEKAYLFAALDSCMAQEYCFR